MFIDMHAHTGGISRCCQTGYENVLETAKKSGYALVQAHPYRGDTDIMDVNFLDGIEINCHPLYGRSFSAKILKTAKEQDLAVTVGCDYHANTRRPTGGMFLPDTISTDKELAEYILSAKEVEIQIDHPANGVVERKRI